MSKKKLLIFSDCYIYGGSERLMSFLVKNGLLNKNFEITFSFRSHNIYLNGMREDFQDFLGQIMPLSLFANDTLFYKINNYGINKYLTKLLKVPFWIARKSGLYLLINFVIFFRHILYIRPDILHINNGGFPGASTCNLLVFVAKLLGVKKIIYQVNNQAQNQSFFSFYRNKKISEFVDVFITSSNMAKINLSQKVGVPLNKIQLIRNIVLLKKNTLSREDVLNSLGVSKNTFVLINVAFLTKRKGQLYLLKAFDRWLKVNDYKIDSCLLLVGDGEDYKILYDYCLNNKLLKFVFFLGYQTHYINYLKAADLVLLPSISDEDLPLVLIESFMLGKCIIGTSLAGISEVINNNINGFLVRTDVDFLIDDLYEKINFLYSNPSEITRISSESKTFSECFSEKRYGQILSKLYNS